MILKCNNCGAPLDVSGGTSRTRCHYCGQTTEVEKLEKVSDETPADWVPPKNWMPPDHSSLAGQSLVYRPVRAIGRAIGLSLRLGVLAIVGTVVWRVVAVVNQATNQVSQSAQSAELEGALNRALGTMTQKINAASGASVDGPIVCSGSESLTVTGRTIRTEVAAGAPVTASGSCQVRLVACHLGGANAVVARGNARVVVEGGSLTGSAAAAALSGNAALDVSGGAMITGGPAISVSGNSRATLRDATVNGAVDTRENGSVDAIGSRLLGAVTGTRRVRK